jgi:hypothetical protein
MANSGRTPVGVYIPRHLRAPDTVLLELTVEVAQGGPVERLVIQKVWRLRTKFNAVALAHRVDGQFIDEMYS